MNQNQVHFSSLSSSNLAPLSRNHPSRGQGPGGNAFHTAAAAISRSLREERCKAIVKNANGFPYSRWFYPLYFSLKDFSIACFIWCLRLSAGLVLDKCTQFTQLRLVSSCQISNGIFTGTTHPGNSKLITHAWMLLRSPLEKEDFLQAAVMVRDACNAFAYQMAVPC